MTGTSGRKRKAVREVTKRDMKKTRPELVVESEESSDHEADSDFELDDSDKSDQSDSDEVDDYNPFGGSDNEDHWCRSNQGGRAKSNLILSKFTITIRNVQ